MEMTDTDRVALVAMTQHQGWPVFIRLAGEMITSATANVVSAVLKGSDGLQPPPYYAGQIDAINELGNRVAQATEELKARAEEIEEERKTRLADRSDSVTPGDTAL